MMQPLPSDAYPAIYRIVLIVGWGIPALVMLWDWRHVGKRWLGVLFGLCALHYLGLAWGIGNPAMELVPVALGMMIAERDGWRRYWPVPLAALAMGLWPVSWTLAMVGLVSYLYATSRPLGRAIFVSGAPMLALLALELLPGFRAWATGDVMPLLLWSVVTTQLYLPAWATVRSGRAGEGHWLTCG